MDGPADRGAGVDSRLGHGRLDGRGAARGVRVQRHLRLGQRDRIRRTARPTGHRRGRPGVAEPRRRADRRGRLGARRRGAGAAGAGRHHAPRDAEGRNHPARRRPDCGHGLRHRLRQPQRAPHRDRRAEARGKARRHRPVLRGARRLDFDRSQRRTACPRAAAARRALHRSRRRGAPHQRVPRPHRPAAALARRPSSRSGGQGGHRDHRDRRGARHHHGAGPDRPVPDGVRHDRHGPGRGRTVAPVLQARRVTNSAEYSQHSRGRDRPGVHHGRRQERRDRRAHRRGAQDPSAGARRHPRRRRIRGTARAAGQGRGAGSRAQREERRGGSRRHRRGGRARDR